MFEQPAANAAPTLPSQRERGDVEAAIACLPAHRRPPSRELGRSSEAAPNPFAGSMREMAKRCEAARHPFRDDTQDWNGKSLQQAIDGLPAHQRPSAKSLLRGNDVIADPIQAASRAPTHTVGHARARSPAKRPTARDGHNGEAGFIDPPNLARLAQMPPVRHHGEGPRPSSRQPEGRDGLDETGLEKGRFFQTGRQLGPLVRRVCETSAGDGEAGMAIDLPAVPAPARPLVTIEKTGARVELVAVCPASRAAGLRPGMALTTARAQLPDLDTRPADPQGDAADLSRLADTLARRWSPSVEMSDADGLLIDLSGVAHLRGGEEMFCRRVVRMLARHGVTARIAVADTPGAAWAVARYGTSEAVHVVAPSKQADVLDALPPAALRLEPGALDLLHRLGVERIGQLTAMPRAPLARRFTRAIVDRLDQALGFASEALDPIVVHDAIVVARRFLEPIATAGAIEQVLRDLTPELAERLREASRGVRSLELVADRVDGMPQRLRIGFARPTRDVPHILRLLLRRIEEIEPGYGIDAMALHVRRCDRLEAETLGPELVEETPPELGTLVDAIANRIGSRRLWRMRPIESDVPERSSRRTNPLEKLLARTMMSKPGDVGRLDERVANHPWHARWRRPARLLPRPEKVHHVLAELPDCPPKRFTWRGQTYRIVRAEGPERIRGEWWRRSTERDALRDYFHVEVETGERFWIFRRGDGVRGETGDLTWYLHGR